MKKRFWKWNAILSLLAYIWVFVATIVLNDGEEPKHLLFFLSIPLTMSLLSLLFVVRNKKKPDDAIIGLSDHEVNTPKKQLRYIMRERGCVAFYYSLAIGLPFRYLSVLNGRLRFWLMLGTFLLGAAYLVYALFDYAKKVGELDESDSSDK